MQDSAAVVHRARIADIDPVVLYRILQLRSAVFVVEQDCVFLEPDGNDLAADTELLWIGGPEGVVATCRLLSLGDDEWLIGRVVNDPSVRSSGVGSALMQGALVRLTELGARRVRLGAQSRLRGWYARFGFEPSGPTYIEDGIIHTPMARALDEGRDLP